MKRTHKDKDSHRWNVYLNGERLDTCLEADDVAGYVIVQLEKSTLAERLLGQDTERREGMVQFKRLNSCGEEML